jgi:hypothetical protein
MKKIGILLLGTYRSGTSALTGVLDSLGFASNYKPNDEDYTINPTGSFNDNYFKTKGANINWSEYFDVKNLNDKWICKHHILLQNNYAKHFCDNFPKDREKWLILTQRNPVNAAKSLNALTNGNYEKNIMHHLNVLDTIYNYWDGNKLLVNFSDLINKTEDTIKNICDNLHVDYIPSSIDLVKKEISKHGD